MLLGGVSPSTDFDVKEYHFEGPKEFFLAGRMQFLPHNVYTSFPFLTEMLTLLGMVLRNDWAGGALVGKSVLTAFVPLTGLAILAAGRRWFGPLGGLVGHARLVDDALGHANCDYRLCGGRIDVLSVRGVFRDGPGDRKI